LKPFFSKDKGQIETMATYRETIHAIKTVCARITMIYQGGDGRIASAVHETDYLNRLEEDLQAYAGTHALPHFTVFRPRDRYWYDIKINEIPINLKLTTGGTDNAFNKVAILFTICGEESRKKNMNYNEWHSSILGCAKKETRDHATEYHYLVVDKRNGAVLLKPILDIHTYKTNPCNILQINWANEFREMEHVTPDDLFKEKIRELVKTVQTSIRQAIAGMNELAEADLDAEL